MTTKSFENELARALARPDLDELRTSLSVYYQWTKPARRRDDDWPNGLDLWFNFDKSDRNLALIALAMAAYDDEEFLILVACGLLESTLFQELAHSGLPLSNEFLDRIVVEARRTPRFRWMLSAMWTSGMPPEKAQKIKEAVGTASCETDPLPPRPWA